MSEGTRLTAELRRRAVGAVMEGMTQTAVAAAYGVNRKTASRWVSKFREGGGNSNDYLSGRNGADVVVGDEGNDRLRGGRGRDILIGGRGRDDIRGGSGDDLLIDGFTSFDTNLEALNAISTEWNSGASYQTRINNLQTGVGPDLVALKTTGPDATVFDDEERDTLKGDRGRDWFLGDNDVDRIRDKRRYEVFTDIDLLDLI